MKVKKSDVVFVQVSSGSELALKPGLNIMGGLQPRGPKAICGMSAKVLMVWSSVPTDAVDDPIIAIEVIVEEMALISDMAVPVDGLAVLSDLFRMLMDIASVVIAGIDAVSIDIEAMFIPLMVDDSIAIGIVSGS